jgi:hypothetical protein
MSKNVPKTIPFLPGHTYQDHLGENHYKVQQFSVINSTNCEKTRFFSETNDPLLIDSMRAKTPLNLTYGNKQKAKNDYIPRIQAPWIKYDR